MVAKKPLFFLSKVYKNYIANSILIIFFFLNVNKKRRKFLFFLSKNRYWPRDNQIDFLFSGHFHIGLVIIIIKQAGYIKKTLFLSIIYQESKKGSYQIHHKIGKKHKVSRPDSFNDASIRYSDI